LFFVPFSFFVSQKMSLSKKLTIEDVVLTGKRVLIR
jgi:hypothetical protein